jgi:hypothetical protein
VTTRQICSAVQLNILNKKTHTWSSAPLRCYAPELAEAISIGSM